MRWLLLLLVLVIGNAQSQGPSPSPTKRVEGSKAKTAKDQQKAKQDQRGTIDAPLVVEVLSPKKNEEERAQDVKDREDKATDARRSLWSNIILVMFNGILAGSTILLWCANRKAARAAKESADAAVRTAMPVLHPRVFNGIQQGMPLHPLEAIEGPFIAYANFAFENFGKSIAIIKDIRATLVLNVGDEFREAKDSELRPLTGETWIPGDLIGDRAFELPIVECQQTFTLTPVEARELLAEGSDARYRRFALVGHVVYDDLFGLRHTRRFYIKMRLKPDGVLFQVPRGRYRHNSITSDQIPKTDPLS